MKNKSRKKEAWFLIAMLLISNFSFAVLISGSVNGVGEQDPGIILGQEATQVTTQPATPGSSPTQVDIVVTEQGNASSSSETTNPGFGDTIKAKAKAYYQNHGAIDIMFFAISLGKAIIDTKNIFDEYGVCSPENKLAGTSNCERCNEDPFVPCTENRCRMLGSCTPGTSKNEDGKPVVTCIPGECDGGLIIVDSLNANWVNPSNDKKMSETGSRRLSIKDELAYDVTDLNLSITTSTYSMCRYGIDGDGKDKEYKEMFNFNDRVWSKTHQVAIDLPDAVVRGQKHKIYVKCESVCGDVHSKENNDYYAEFEFEKVPDKLPPSISLTDPDETFFYSSDIEDVDLTVTLSENGICKYSTKKNDHTNDWGQMNDFESCKNNQACITRAENKCAKCSFNLNLKDTELSEEIDWDAANYSTLSIADEVQAQMDLTGKSNIYHISILCQDADANRMEEADGYFFKTADPYTLKITEPAGDVEERDIPITINTSRSTKCRLSFDEERSFDEMQKFGDVFDTSHKVQVENLTAGKRKVFVKCMDAVNLLVSDSKEFNVKGDTLPPKVIRVYYTNAFEPLLTIKTDEYAECKYSTDKNRECNFNLDSGEDEGVLGMMSVDDEGKEHTAVWDSSKVYYVRCKDWKEITPSNGKCSENGIIRPYSLVENTYPYS